MNSSKPGVEMTRSSNGRNKSMGRKSRYCVSFSHICFICILLGIIVLLPIGSHAQTLDNAVNSQLESIAGTRCNRLLGNDSLDVLTGTLETICTPGPGGSLTSQASGGSAATPVSLPAFVKKRMEEKDDEKESKTGSTDATISLRSGLNLFISGEYESMDREITNFEDGFNSDIGRLTAGADIQVTNSVLAGLAFDTSRHNGNYSRGGNFDITSYGFTGYASVIPFDKAFLQAYAGWSAKATERLRTAAFTDETGVKFSGTPDSDFDADDYSAGILIGYDHPLGSVTISPRAGLNWIDTSYDTYSETDTSGLALTFHDDETSSLQSSLGLQASAAKSAAFGVVTYQGSLDWKHEYDQDQRNVEVSFVDDPRAKRFTYQTEEPDRDFYEFNAGVSLVLPGGVQTFINYRTLLGHSFLDSHAGTIGLRVEL